MPTIANMSIYLLYHDLSIESMHGTHPWLQETSDQSLINWFAFGECLTESDNFHQSLWALKFRDILRVIIFHHIHGGTEKAVCKRGKEKVQISRRKQKQSLEWDRQQQDSLVPGLILITASGLNAIECSFPTYLAPYIS